MAKYRNTIAYQIQTKLDATGLNQLQQQLSSVSKSFTEMGKSNSAYAETSMRGDIARIQQVQQALSKSFNTNLNLIDLSTFKKELGGLSFGELQSTMSKIPEGAKAFNSILGTVGQIDTGFKNISSLSDKIMNTFGNTVRWGVTASIFQTIQNSLYRSVDYVKELDTSLNNIQIVTGETSSNLTEWAKSANEAAAQLGASTVAFTDAAQLYAQNGYTQEDYTKLAELTTKVANVTQQSTSEVSEQITSLMAGYKMSIDEAEDSLAGMAVVAAASASDLGELAAAEQKVASAASTLGVSQDELTAQLSTIISVTREAPEQVGNSLKTIYARLGDLSLGETLEDGVSLGDVSSTLDKVGIAVLDVNGEMRSMGDILEDLMAKWQELGQAEQQALAVKLAGKYQYNNLMTLMNNSDMYYQQKEMAGSSQGALDEQQAIYMESMEAKLQTLKTKWEGVIQSVVDADAFKPFIDAASTGLDIVSDIADTIGGMGPALTLVASLMTKAFSQNIASGVANMVANKKRSNLLAQNEDAIITTMGGSDLNGTAATFLKNTVGNRSTLTGEQAVDYNEKLQRYVEVDNQYIDAEQKLAQVQAENMEYFSEKGIFIDTLTGKIKGWGATAYEEMQKENNALSKTNFQYAELRDTISSVIRGDKLSYTEEELKKLESLTADLSNNNDFAEMTGEVEGFIKALKKGNNEAVELGKLLSSLLSDEIKNNQSKQANNQKKYTDDNGVTMQERIAKEQNAVQDQRAAALAKQNAMENALADAQSVAYQQLSQQLINITASVGQLAFAWQSFQNLGSIWANSDTTVGEKVYQIFLSLTMVIPQVLSSVKSVSSAFTQIQAALAKVSTAQENYKTAQAETAAVEAAAGAAEQARAAKFPLQTAWLEAKKKAQEGLTQEEEKGNLATGAAAAKSGVLATANAAATLATKGLTAAVKELSAAFNITPVGMFLTVLSAAVMIIPTVIGAISQLNEEALEKQAEKVEELKTEWDELSSKVSTFETAYETFKSTGEVTDDFTQSCKDAAEALNVEGANALIAAGKYDELAKAIRRQQNVKAQDSIDEIDSNSSKNNESLSGTWNNSSTDTDFDQKMRGAGATITNNLGADYLKSLALDSTSSGKNSAYENISTIESNIDKLQAKLKELGNSYNEATYNGTEAAWNKEKAAIQGAIDKMQEYLDLEDVKTAKDNASSKAEIGVSRNDFQEAVSSAGSVEDIKKIFSGESGDYGTADYFKTMEDDYSAQLEYMVTNVEDANAKAKLELEQSKISFGQAMFSAIQNDSELGGKLTTEDIDRNVEEIISEIENAASLTEDEKISFMAGIDWSKSLPEINNSIQQVIESGSLDSLSVGVNTSQDTSIDQARDSRLEEYGVDDETISSYQELLNETTELGDAQEELQQQVSDANKAVEDAEKAFGKDSDEVKDAKKNLDKANKSLESYEDNQKDLVKMAAQTQKGMDKLNDCLEDNEDILRDGDKTSLEYADAMDETRQAVADMVNVSKEDISPEFVSDNLDDIKAAAEGDTEALQRLRVAAAQDILVNITQTGNLTDEHLAYLQNKLTELGGMNLEVGANLDDQGFIDSLNNMLESGEMTQEQVQSCLNAIGYDPQIEYEEVTTTTTTPAKSYSVKILGAEIGSIEYPETEMTTTTKVPKITSIHSSGTGSYTPHSSSSKSSGGSGSSGSSGGGSGSSPSSSSSSDSGTDDNYDDSTVDITENEIDRYEKVNAHLDDISNNLDKVADEQDRLTGQKYIENLMQQVSLLKEQVEWEEKKLEIEKQEAAEYKNILGSDFGVKFNDQGFVENYADIYNQLLAQLNSYEQQYNASTDKAAKESLQKQIDSAQDRLDNFSDYIDKYDTLLTSTITESEQKIQEYYDKIEDLRIEAYNDSIEALSDLKSILEDRADFNTALSRLLSGDYSDDDPYQDTLNALEKIKAYWNADSEAMQEYYDTLISKQKEILSSSAASDAEKKWAQTRINSYNTLKQNHSSALGSATGDGLLSMAMKDLTDIQAQYEQFQKTGSSEVFGENSAELIETMKTVEDNAKDIIESLKDSMSDLKDSILDTIDKVNDEIDDMMDKYDNINDKLDTYYDLIETINGETDYDALNQVLDAQIANGQNQVTTINQTIESLKQMQAACKEGSDEWKELEETIEDQSQKLLETTQDTLDKMVTKYQNAVKKAMDSWTSNTALGTDLDWVKEEWEMITDNANQYLDDVNSAYNIQKLQGKYLTLLDGSNSLSVQSKITEQMNQQLAYLREKDKLSQYDVDYANAQLEILQKTIALEEAQANKNQMKLKRDNQGNYSYVYTANESDVASAQSDLLDAQNSAYNLSKDAMVQNQEDALNKIISAKEKILNLYLEAQKTGTDVSDKVAEVVANVTEYLNGCSEQFKTAQSNIINDFYSMVDSLSTDNLGNLQEIFEQMQNGNNEAFNNIDQRFSTSIGAWLENLDEFKKATTELFSDDGALQKAFKDYQASLEALAEKSKVPLTNMSTAVSQVKDEMDKLNASTATYQSTLKDLSGTIESAEAEYQKMQSQIANAQNAMRAFQSQYNDVSQKLAVAEREKSDLQSEYQKLQREYDAYKDEQARKAAEASSAQSAGGGDGSWDPYNDAYGIWVYGWYGNGGYWYGNYAAEHGEEKANQVLALFNSGYGYTWMDTGGYTGDWGSNEGWSEAKNGKLAVLHSKELVLNASDTENILQAVQAVRQLTTNFRNGAFEDAVSAFNKYGSDLLQTTVEGLNSVAQDVHIEATFPNVKGAEEIESALLSLTNGAVQYASRNGQF